MAELLLSMRQEMRAARRPQGGQAMEYRGVEMRVDWVMRQYVETIVQFLLRGGDQHSARANMTSRGVPVHVQDRVLKGLIVH